MTDELKKVDMYATPTDFTEIVKFCNGASTPADAITAAYMAWNLAVEWHFNQDKCCDKLRKMKAVFDDELTYAEHLAAKAEFEKECE
jgi:hypothetical protein